MTAQKRQIDEGSPVERLLISIDHLRKRHNSKSAHFFRTSLRRFQAWEEVIHPKLDSDKKSAMKFLSKLRKASGKLRDSEVHLDLLDALDGATGKEKKKVERALKLRRKAARSKLESLLSDADLKTQLNHLRLMGEPPLASHQASENPLPTADQLALDAYRTFVESRAPLSPENLHSYRLACKGFRYKAELAGDTAQARTLIDAWKSVQDVSGDWHDYVTLSELTEEVCGDCTLHSLLLGMRDKKYDESVASVEKAERQLLTTPEAAKKRPAGVRKNHRRSSVA
ncbi:MAG TPA: CHAD domain-containing protein [Terriglobales bacterium]|nr:CHAD domain-containing protein [Terriglobales bacterium]